MSRPACGDPGGAGDRMPRPAVLDAEQEVAVATLAAGPRGELVGPFVPLLRSPELMDRVQLVGAYLRFESRLADHLVELVVLCVARHWNQEFEWGHHHPLALRAGLSPAVVEAVGAGHSPGDVAAAEDVLAVWRLVDVLLTTREVDDATYARALDVLGERDIVEAVTCAGYYTTLAMVMNTARTPAPPGAARLPELRRVAER